MNIIFYKNSAEQNRMDKTDYIEEVLSIEGTLRDNTSIVNPTIVVQTSGLISANYAYIEEFNRYYFINDIVAINLFLYEISMSCDVLMTYKNEIGNLSAVIARNENDYNVYIPDEKLPLSNVRDLIVPTFGRLGLNNPFFQSAIKQNDNYCFILGVYQRSELSYTEGNHFTYGDYKINLNDLQVNQNLANSPYTTASSFYALTYKQLMDFLIEISTLDLPSLFFGSAAKYVLSVKVYPHSFKSSNNNNDSAIIIDNRTMNSKGYELIPQGISSYDSLIIGNPLQLESIPVYDVINNNPYFTVYNDCKFLLNKPYSECSLYLPYYGYIDIDLKIFDGVTYDSICVYISYELINGTAEYRIMAYKYDESGGNNFVLIKTVQFQFGIDVPFGASDAVDVARNSISSSLNTIMQGIGIYASHAAMPLRANSAKSQQRLQVIADINAAAESGSLTGRYVDSLISQSLHYVPVESGESTNYTAFTSCPLFYMLYNLAVPITPNNYAKLYGRPSMKYSKISDLSGYTEIDNIHIDNIPTATQQELNNIQRLLYTGILL